jgi:hypothetical protein
MGSTLLEEAKSSLHGDSQIKLANVSEIGRWFFIHFKWNFFKSNLKRKIRPGSMIINNRKQPSKRNSRNMYWPEIVMMLLFFMDVVHRSSGIIFDGHAWGDMEMWRRDARPVGHLCNMSHMEAIRFAWKKIAYKCMVTSLRAIRWAIVLCYYMHK